MCGFSFSVVGLAVDREPSGPSPVTAQVSTGMLVLPSPANALLKTCSIGSIFFLKGGIGPVFYIFTDSRCI